LRLVLASLLVVCLLPAVARAARTVVVTDAPIVIKVELRQTTAIVFPEAIHFVSFGLTEQQLSPDYKGAYLFLIPLTEDAIGRVFVLGEESGTLYHLRLTQGTPGDDLVRVTTKAAQPPPVPLSLASLLRLWRTGQSIPTQIPAEIPLPSVADPRVALGEHQTVQVQQTIGLSLVLRNLTPHPLALDLRVGQEPSSTGEDRVALHTWTWPPRLTIKALSADPEILPPEGQTRLTILFQARP